VLDEYIYMRGYGYVRKDGLSSVALEKAEERQDSLEKTSEQSLAMQGVTSGFIPSEAWSPPSSRYQEDSNPGQDAANMVNGLNQMAICAGLFG
jgi:hypothetical protein